MTRTIRFRDVTDGLSSTFAVGEGDTSRPVCHGAGCSVAAVTPAGRTALVENAWIVAVTNYDVVVTTGLVAGGMFLLEDGSARFVSENIDQGVYRSMSTISGGEVVGEF